MKLLSIDVGMKNLAFCLFDVTNSKNFLVTKWDVVDICQEKKYKCCYIEKGKECVADAKFFKDDKYYCKRHATKQELKVPPNTHDITKIKKFKIKEIGSMYIFTLLYCFLEKLLLNKSNKKN